jgi:hypothetical protein
MSGGDGIISGGGISGGGGHVNPNTRFVMPSHYTPQSIGHMAKYAMADFWASAAKLYTPQLKQTTWPLQMVWFSLSFGSYGLLTWINTLFVAVHLENVYFNAFLFALSNLPGNILTALLMDRVGRSTMLVGSVLCAAGGLFSFAAFAASATLHAPGIVLSACIFQCFTISAWNTIDCMTSELFPTSVRSTGMGVCAASGRVGAMVAQFVNGALVANPVRLLLVASITLLLGAATPCLLPNGGDMTGQPVQDEVVGTSASAPAVVGLVDSTDTNTDDNNTDDNDEEYGSGNDNENGNGNGAQAVYRPVSSWHDSNDRAVDTNDTFQRNTYQNMDMA